MMATAGTCRDDEGIGYVAIKDKDLIAGDPKAVARSLCASLNAVWAEVRSLVQGKGHQ